MKGINATDLIRQIKSIWKTKDRNELIEILDNCILGGSTGSEISGNVFKFLKSLKDNNADAYYDVIQEIDTYLNWVESGIYGMFNWSES